MLNFCSLSKRLKTVIAYKQINHPLHEHVNVNRLEVIVYEELLHVEHIHITSYSACKFIRNLHGLFWLSKVLSSRVMNYKNKASSRATVMN